MENQSELISGKILNHSFYRQETLAMAKALLGKYFQRKIKNKWLVGKIVETEAYHEVGDPSCHAHHGKTARNEVMFGPPGRLYVYFTYGMHYCLNVVTEKEGIAAAVLIRAVEPLEGREIMQKNRGNAQLTKNLCNGPAKFCQAFGITTLQNGHDLQSESIHITEGETIHISEIDSDKRIGITKGTDLPWRFLIKNNPFVSKPVQHKHRGLFE